jgi:hypothetical protein
MWRGERVTGSNGVWATRRDRAKRWVSRCRRSRYPSLRSLIVFFHTVASSHRIDRLSRRITPPLSISSHPHSPATSPVVYISGPPCRLSWCRPVPFLLQRKPNLQLNHQAPAPSTKYRPTARCRTGCKTLQPDHSASSASVLHAQPSVFVSL